MTKLIEVQDVFSEYGIEYCNNHNLPLHLRKVINNIISCRTSELGGHIDECEDCGHTRISYNSCRDRHCPKCQTLKKERWLEDRKNDLLPVTYFHVVFIIPQELNFLTLTNQKEMYSILFKATSETLLELSRDPKYLGAEIGFTTILHTWGQNLMNHPHIHCVVPGGGLDLSGNKWISSKNDFFIPVKVLSRKFRGKFLYYLKKEYYSNPSLKFINENEDLKYKDIFRCFIDKHRVAISNNRIVAFENGLVVFKWRDYKDNKKEKFMTITVEEFIRRFLMHVLPQRFVKIRHYGILSNRSRKTKLKKCKFILKILVLKDETTPKLNTAELLLKLTGVDINICPCCSGKMNTKRKLEPKISGPPEINSKIA